MSVYDVWAPNATTVHLHLDGELLPLAAEPDTGWWRAPADLDRGPGHRYGFVLDGGDSPEGETPLPDPRSRRQPEGVHGLSETYDPGAFAWTDDAWTGRQLAGSVVYELHIGTFTPEGTLDSAIEKLPYLVDLGVDLVELLPVNGVNGRWNWGYDGVDWFTVTDNYGGPEAYQRFVDAAHAAGLGVVQDVVYNHLGPSGNYLPLFGPYLSSKHANTWGDNVNLDDDGAHEVREFILDNTAMWLDDYHVDGLRLDAVHALKDDSEVHLLQELAERTAALSSHLRRPLSLIAESDLNDPRLITPRDGGGFGPDHRQGYGLDAQWSDDFHHAVHVALTGETTGYYADFEPLGALAKVLTKGFFHDGTWSSFREATHGYPVDTEHMPTWRLVVANQNHDQIGNRAIGDRLAATLDDGQLIIAATLTLAGPFTPMLFMGEEWAASTPWQFFTSHPEHDLGEATAKGRIAEFAKMGWDESSVPDPQEPSTFENSKLDWSELETGRHAVLLDAYRRLGALRRSEPALTDPGFGETGVEYDGDARWLVLTRGDLKIAINLADQEARVAVSASTVLFASDESIVPGASLLLPAHSVAIVR